MTGHALFSGVDRAVFAASYADRLQRAGLSVSIPALERCAASLDAVGPLTLSDAYWLLRLSFVTREPDVATFDAVFETVFDVLPHLEMGFVPSERVARQRVDQPDRDDERLVGVQRAPDDVTSTAAALPWATLPAFGDGDRDDSDAAADDLAVPELRPSTEMVEADRPFDLLDNTELERIGARLESLAHSWPQRRSRRRARSSRGGVAMRRTMRNAMRTGGDVMQLSCDRAQTKPRPVVVLLDVSGSMEAYARIYLHLIRPLAVARQAEVFAFATELSRVTPAVRRRTTAEVIEHMNDSVGDRFSGTKLATGLSTLLRHRTWSTATRGAVVLICSDGWDADEPEDLDRAMARLSLRAHRIVWVNPRAAAPGFEPLTQGMAAARPYCDVFLAGNTARSMTEVVAALTDAPQC